MAVLLFLGMISAKALLIFPLGPFGVNALAQMGANQAQNLQSIARLKTNKANPVLPRFPMITL